MQIPEDIEDRELLQNIADREKNEEKAQDSLGKLYEKYSREVMKKIRQVGSKRFTKEDIADITQDVFLKVLEVAKNFGGKVISLECQDTDLKEKDILELLRPEFEKKQKPLSSRAEIISESGGWTINDKGRSYKVETAHAKIIVYHNATVKSWLLGIARNIALARLREINRDRENPQPPKQLKDNDEILVSTSNQDEPEPDGLLGLLLDRELVDKAIQRLSESVRETFRLHYELHSYKDISKKLGRYIGTISSSLNAARVKFILYIIEIDSYLGMENILNSGAIISALAHPEESGEIVLYINSKLSRRMRRCLQRPIPGSTISSLITELNRSILNDYDFYNEGRFRSRTLSCYAMELAGMYPRLRERLISLKERRTKGWARESVEIFFIHSNRVFLEEVFQKAIAKCARVPGSLWKKLFFREESI